MKSDLDTFMQSKNLDAILVIGNGDHNPAMVYLTGGGHFGGAALFKKRGGNAVLLCNDMERDEAAKSGLTLIPASKYNYDELMKEANGNPTLASAIRYKRILTEQGIQGRIGIYGNVELGSSFAVFTHLQKLMLEIELV